MQVKLLRVLQERTVRPVGGTTEIRIDVRVIAATNRDLDKQVAESTFREDLYYRLSVIPIRVPGLRERRAKTFRSWSNHFLKKYAAGRRRALSVWMPLRWPDSATTNGPGNVRQLENTVERAVALESTNQLRRTARRTSRAKAAAARQACPACLDRAGAAAFYPKASTWRSTSPRSNARCCRQH